MAITATLTHSGRPVTGATAEAQVVRPDGMSQVVALYDDGAHRDGAAEDGVYGKTAIRASGRAGSYTLTAVVLADTSGAALEADEAHDVLSIGG